MNIKDTLQDGLSLSKTNYQLFIPALAATLIAGLITLIGAAVLGEQTIQLDAAAGPAGVLGSVFAGQSLWGNMLFGALSTIVVLIGHGTTIAIAHQAADGHRPDLMGALRVVQGRIVALVIAAAIVGILVGIGTALLILPGLIAGYLLMFTFVGVVAGGLDSLPAIRRSFDVVRKNLFETALFFLLLLAIGVVFAIVSSIVYLIPAVGGLLSLILGAIYTGITSMLLLLGYRSFEALPVSGGRPAQGQESSSTSGQSTQS